MKRPALRGTAARIAAVAILCAASGCDLAPDYRPPSYVLPDSYTGTKPFTVARPADADPRGAWWEAFGDPTLNRLELLATANNPTLQAIAEQYAQSRDLAAEARANLFPQFSAGGTTSDSKRSSGRPFPGATGSGNIAALNQIQASASWEPDFWSRIRNQTRTEKQLAQASAADLASARLSLQSELAQDFIALRGVETEMAVYRQSIQFYENAVHITTLRLQGLIASGLDVARAQSQLSAARALLTDAESNRAVLLHAIAVVVGADPITFTLPIGGVDDLRVAAVPAQVPSALLQRRPDIAAAERRMAAANSAIGISRAAFYPDISINLLSGFQDTGFSLASLPNSIWSVGASAVLPLFEGGLRRAELQRAWSQYAQQRDRYRATILQAFREVQDGLVQSTQLGIETAQQNQAVQAAEKAQEITLRLYTGGLTNYLDALVAQVTALSARIALVEVQTRQLQARVSLAAALGGGWSATALPSENAVLPFNPVAPLTGRDREPRPDGTGEPSAPRPGLDGTP